MRLALSDAIQECDTSEQEGDYHGGLQRVRQALEQLTSAEISPEKFSLLERKARLLTYIGEYSEAQDLVKEIIAQQPDSHLKVDALVTLGVCISKTGNIYQAEEYIQRGIDLGHYIKYNPGLYRAFSHLANSIYLVRGQFDLALTFMEQAAEFCRDQPGINWRLPYLRAYIYQITGDYYRVRQALDDLLTLVKPGTALAGYYYCLWAKLALDEEAIERAQECLYLALRIASQTGIPELNTEVRLQLSRLHRLQKQQASAYTWADDAIQFVQRFQIRHLLGQALLERARVSWEMGNFSLADADLLEAQKILSSCDAKYDLSVAAFLQAVWYHQENHPQSEFAWLSAANLIRTHGYEFILEREQELAFPLLATQLRNQNPIIKKTSDQLMAELARVPPARLQISGLGQFAVWQGRRRIADAAWQRRKAGELFRYLLLQPEYAATRDQVLEDLWTETPLDAALDLFHQATSTLRHILEPDLPNKFPSRYLSVEGERVMLKLPVGSVIDFEQFEQQVSLAIQSENVDNLKKALSMYTGELYPMDRYSDWSRERREKLEEIYHRALLALGQAYLRLESYYNALECAQLILKQDAWFEDAALLGMQACMGLNDIPRALRMYQGLVNSLEHELGIRPRQDIQELAEKLRKR
ncbi:MAG: BTAD domain-containing putative transcriptional regulator [Anaerolineales bacterium]